MIEPTGNALAGKTLLYTGTFRQFSREGLEAAIVGQGGKVVSSVSKKLSYLIVGENAGPAKVTKAEELGVPMIDEQTFVAMIGEKQFVVN